MFFKFKMNHSGHGHIYDYVIIEGESDDDAYERAAGELPQLFGEVDDEFPEEVTNPLSEPWPIFTDAFFSREMDKSEALLARTQV